VKKIIILGTGGNCIDILDTINEINKKEKKYDCIGFLDDNRDKWGKEIWNVKVLGPLDTAKEHQRTCFFVNGIGSSHNYFKKEHILSKTGILLNRFENIIHPTASVSNFSHLGRGVVILQNATIASNAVIGNHVIILPNSIVNHDVIIKDYSCITSGVCISGGVKVGKSCYIGSNSSIKENIVIGDNSLIGIGSVVLSNVSDNSVMVGSPAKLLRTIQT